MYEVPPDGSSSVQADPLKAVESPNGDGFSDITQESTNDSAQATASSGRRLSTVNAVFEAGPVGLELVNRKHGGVIVKSVQPGFQAAHTRIIRRAMGIYTINEEDYSTADLKAVMKTLREAPRPVTVMLRYLAVELHHNKLADQAQVY